MPTLQSGPGRDWLDIQDESSRSLVRADSIPVFSAAQEGVLQICATEWC
jgi:hypothetical protein